MNHLPLRSRCPRRDRYSVQYLELPASRPDDRPQQALDRYRVRGNLRKVSYLAFVIGALSYSAWYSRKVNVRIFKKGV